jgi:hypothetical protein
LRKDEMISNDDSACPEREPQLQAYLFGELGDEELEGLQWHLEECAGCRHALAEARRGLAALDMMDEEPLPFLPHSPVMSRGADSGRAWTEFLERVPRAGYARPKRGVFRHNQFALGAVAAAATLLIGIGLGRWMFVPDRLPSPSASDEIYTAGVVLKIDQEAIDALVRAEFLADLAIPYVNEVLRMWTEIMELDPEHSEIGDMGAISARARDLIRDGRLLIRGLDRDRDEVFMAVIGQSELFLEDIAALGGESTAAADLLLIQDTLRGSRLGQRLVALDVNSDLATALEASGWIGEEYKSSLELRR